MQFFIRCCLYTEFCSIIEPSTNMSPMSIFGMAEISAAITRERTIEAYLQNRFNTYRRLHAD